MRSCRGPSRLSFPRDLHPLHSHHFAWRTMILPLPESNRIWPQHKSGHPANAASGHRTLMRPASSSRSKTWTSALNSSPKHWR